jgi:hypothetical protein
MERRLTAILAADVVGYSRFAGLRSFAAKIWQTLIHKPIRRSTKKRAALRNRTTARSLLS